MTRVFISSTFNDMQAERDVLSRLIFPRVRDALPYAAQVTEIDLRWGLTRAMTTDGGAVQLCLESVDAAHCVLGMLGARTGWQPESEFVAAFDKGFSTRVPAGCGLTELELRRGFEASVSGYQPTPHVLILQSPETEVANSPLLAWLRRYHPDKLWPYSGPENFEQQAAQAVHSLLQQGGKVSKHSTASFHVPRPRTEAAVSRALEPRWLRRARPILFHSPPGAGLTTTLHSVMSAKEDVIMSDGRLGWAVTGATAHANPHQPAEVAAAAMRAGAGAMVFDHFEDGFTAPERATLSILPDPHKCQLRIVVATHLDRLAQEAAAFGWQVETFAPPAPDETLILAVAMLERFGKKLEPQHAEMLRRAPWIGNLNNTIFALHELRRFGWMETMGARLGQLVGHDRSGALAGDVIAQLDGVLPPEWTGSIARIVLSLASSLRGVEAWQVPHLAGPDALPPTYWSIMQCTLTSGLTERDGLVDVTHGPLLDWALDHAGANPKEHNGAVARIRALADKHTNTESTLAHPVLLFRQHGADALARHLSDAPTVAQLIQETPGYFEGCLDLLPLPHQRRVVACWAKDRAAFNHKSGVNFALALQADRIGERHVARQLLTGVTEAAGFDDDDRLIARATILSDRKAVNDLVARITGPEAPASRIMSAGLSLFVDGAVTFGRSELRTIIAALTSRPHVGGSLQDDAQLQILLGQCHLLVAEPKQALARFQVATAAARRFGQARFLCLALERGATAALELSKFSLADAFAEECRGVAERSELGRLESLAFSRLTISAARRARWTAAYELNAAHRARVSEAGIDALSVPDKLLAQIESGTLR